MAAVMLKTLHRSQIRYMVLSVKEAYDHFCLCESSCVGLKSRKLDTLQFEPSGTLLKAQQWFISTVCGQQEAADARGCHCCEN